MNILLTGGGTMGPVSPLLAIIPLIQEAGDEVVFVGTADGPERPFVEEMLVPFFTIRAPKLHRFITAKNLAFPFLLLVSLVQAMRLLHTHKPDVIVSAGGYTATPLSWMGHVMGIPSVIHQQDVHPTMTNKLIRPIAAAVTVAFEESLNDFTHTNAQWIGNPVRDLTPTTQQFTWDDTMPTVLIFGGGTGAQGINALVTEELCEFANVIHVTGRGRAVHSFTHERYHAFELLGEEMKEALHKADVVVGRAGLGTMTELAALQKAAIIIPMPQSHQEQNAYMLKEAKAAQVFDQRTLTPHGFTQAILKLLKNKREQNTLAKNIAELLPQGANERFLAVIQKAGQK